MPSPPQQQPLPSPSSLSSVAFPQQYKNINNGIGVDSGVTINQLHHPHLTTAAPTIVNANIPTTTINNHNHSTIMAILNDLANTHNDGSQYYTNQFDNNNNSHTTNITLEGNQHLTSSSSSSSSTSSSTCDGLDCYPDSFFIAITVVTIFLAVVGGTGNALTVVAILTSRLRNNINSILICNLSFADTLYCLLLLPMQATAFYLRDWSLGETLCELYAALRIWLIGVNMTLLSCIAFYRFLHVVHTNTHASLSRTRWFSLAVVVCWAFPFFFSFTPLVGWWGTFAFQDRILQCTFDTHTNKTHKLTVITLGYVIPCVFILVCYARIGCVVFTSRRRSSRGSIYRRQRAKRESFRLTAMMVFIFLGFLVGTTPYFLINTVDKSLRYPAPHVWTPVLAWFMYSLNPVIYTVMDHQFQNAYRRLLCCQFGKNACGGVPNQDMGSYQERNSALLKNRA